MKVDETKGSYRVCRADELQALTEAGWSLVFIERTTDWVLPPPNYDPATGRTWGGQEVKTAPSLAERPVFVLAKHRDVELEELRAARRAAETRSGENSSAAWAAKEEAKAAKLLVAKAEKAAAADRELAEACRASTKATEGSLRRIEADLAKVRREVGEREWSRIVGGGQ